MCSVNVPKTKTISDPVRRPEAPSDMPGAFAFQRLNRIGAEDLTNSPLARFLTPLNPGRTSRPTPSIGGTSSPGSTYGIFPSVAQVPNIGARPSIPGRLRIG